MAKQHQPTAFTSLQSKARHFLEVGPDEYFRTAYFRIQHEALSPEEKEALRTGCQQILENHGLTPDDPLKDVGIDGFWTLMTLFHFEIIGQAIVNSNREYFLDEMIIKDMYERYGKIALYNRVRNMYPAEE